VKRTGRKDAQGRSTEWSHPSAQGGNSLKGRRGSTLLNPEKGGPKDTCGSFERGSKTIRSAKEKQMLIGGEGHFLGD